MTATSYVTLDNDDLGANKIFRAATASALDTNPVSIAQRGTGAPWLNGVGAIEAITSGSGNWTVPAGVYRIKVTAVGGGGGDSAASAGSATTFSSLTANGGAVGASPGGGSGGTASGGTLNIPGANGQSSTNTAGDYNPGFGGCSMMGSIGHGGNGNGGGGGGGGCAVKVFSVEPADVLAYSVGASGGGNSTAGIIIIEY